MLLGLMVTIFLTAACGNQQKYQRDILGIEWVQINAGEFLMGSETASDDARLVRTVYLDSYYIAKTEVTVGQFRAFVDDTEYKTDAERGSSWRGTGGWVLIDGEYEWKPDASWHNPYLSQNDDHPVVLVSWNDAAAFCDWLTEKTGKQVWLPTEAQWEKACRAGSPDALYGPPNLIAWYQGNSDLKTHRVAIKRPNAFGLYDMIGNVREWCRDWHADDYYSKSPLRNPTGPSTGDYRVHRGMAFDSPGWLLHSAGRLAGAPDHREIAVGFRICFE